MLFIEQMYIESDLDIYNFARLIYREIRTIRLIFVRLKKLLDLINKYNQKVDIEIKILKLLKTLLYNKKNWYKN
jgi:hypothetical protein